MAPMRVDIDHNALEQQLKDTIQSLHNIMVQTTAYDNHAPSPAVTATAASTARPTRDVLAAELAALSRSLQTVHRTATTHTLPNVPPELIQYVDNGRNPDIYTREFVEVVRRGNQIMRGKQIAFASFRDILAGEIESAMPELRDDAAAVVAATGGAGASGSSNGHKNANGNGVS